MTNSCLVCREVSGQVPLPGGLLAHDDLVADFAGLNAEEAAAIGVGISRWSAALKRMGAMRVYVATIGHRADHLHVHLLPRWPGTPEDVPWHSVDDWPGARMGNFASAEKTVSLIRRNDQQ